MALFIKVSIWILVMSLLSSRSARETVTNNAALVAMTYYDLYALLTASSQQNSEIGTGQHHGLSLP